MTNSFYTVEQISDMLNIHPKTIQRYIREGKLCATKIGKSWRVTGHDLSVFTESAETSNTSKKSDKNNEGKLTVSSVIDIDVAGTEEAIRIINALTAALNAKPPEYGRSSMHTQYIEAENTVRVTLWGNVRFMAAMMETVAVLTENNEME